MVVLIDMMVTECVPFSKILTWCQQENLIVIHQMHVKHNSELPHYLLLTHTMCVFVLLTQCGPGQVKNYEQHSQKDWLGSITRTPVWILTLQLSLCNYSCRNTRW